MGVANGTGQPSLHNHGEDQGCGRIKMLPSSWTLPFGVDKLVKVIKAERNRNLPIVSLEEHKRYGDTYGQYAGGLFTIVTRDSRIISSLLSGQYHNFGHGSLRKLCFGPLLGDGRLHWRRSGMEGFETIAGVSDAPSTLFVSASS